MSYRAAPDRYGSLGLGRGLNGKLFLRFGGNGRGDPGGRIRRLRTSSIYGVQQ
jgi:hypothetical protein